MTEIELKKRLITRIKSLKDPLLLEEVSRLIEPDSADDDYILSEQQKKDVEEAQEQYKKGQFLSNTDADKETDQWLEE